MIENLSDREIAQRLAHSLRTWRMDPRGAGMTQTELSVRSGVGLTPLKRFEKTGGITLKNLVALLRALDLLDALENLIPAPSAPSPLELLKADRAAAAQRKRAPRSRSTSPATRSNKQKSRG